MVFGILNMIILIPFVFFVDFKNQASQITVASHAQGPEMQARHTFLVTTLVICGAKISEDVAF